MRAMQHTVEISDENNLWILRDWFLRNPLSKNSQFKVHKLFSPMILTVRCIARILYYNVFIFWHYKKIRLSISFLSSKCKIRQRFALTSELSDVYNVLHSNLLQSDFP